MEDKELVKMFNLTLKMRETILFFLIAVINGLIWIDSNIGLDTCARGRWINRLIQTQSISLQYTLKKMVELWAWTLCASECRASVQIALCISFLFKLIIFKSIIQYIFMKGKGINISRKTLTTFALWEKRHYPKLKDGDFLEVY